MSDGRILVVDDEPAITLSLSDHLETEGFVVEVKRNGEEALEALKSFDPDLILLDVMMPKMDGFSCCRELRRQGSMVPVIMLTARSDEVDKVMGLEFGADDYVVKPFSLREVVARIRANLRRVEAGDPSRDLEVLEFDDVQVDFKAFAGVKGEEELSFTPKEIKILRLLAMREGEVVSREEILDRVWGEDVYVTTRSVDNQILSLRRKIEFNSDSPERILSVRGVGYKFVGKGAS